MPTFGLNVLIAEATNSADQTERSAQSFFTVSFRIHWRAGDTRNFLTRWVFVICRGLDDDDVSDIDDLQPWVFPGPRRA